MLKVYTPLGIVLGALSLGCSTGDEQPVLEECVGAWQPLVAEEGAVLTAFASSGSKVYFTSIRGASFTSDGLKAVELGDGVGESERIAPTLLASELWAGPDSLVVRANQQLVNVNLTSGAEEVLLDLGPEFDSATSALTVSDSEFFWSLSTERGVEIRRSSRMAGESSVLYSNEEDVTVQRLHVVGNYLLALLGEFGVLRVELASGDVARLSPLDGNWVGFGPDGIYYQRQAPLPASGGRATQQELWYSYLDGSSPRLLWTAPAGYFLAGVGTSPDGEQVALGGTEVFSNGSQHATLRNLSEDGEPLLVACDPEVGMALGAPVFVGTGTLMNTTRSGDWQLAFVAN